jgi:outer membrane protein OmpA-like peptidoglycan-associated protein
VLFDFDKSVIKPEGRSKLDDLAGKAKGEQPVASNKTAEGRAKNRRTEIEVIGTRRN